MWFGREMLGVAVAIALLPTTASAVPIDDLVARLNTLETENAELKARVAKLEAAGLTRALPEPAKYAQSFSTESIRIVETQKPSAERRPTPWQGPYLFLAAGQEWSRSAGVFLVQEPVRDKLAGPLGAFGAGDDVEIGRTVLGVRVMGEYDGATGHQYAYGNQGAQSSCLIGADSSAFLAGVAQKQFICRSSEGATGEFLGRLGYTFDQDRALAYVTGGVAVSRLSASYAFNVLPFPGTPGLSTETTKGAALLVGGSLGGGLEYRLNRLISVGAEWEFRDFSSKSLFNSFHYSIYQGPSLVVGDQNVGLQPHDRTDELFRVFMTFHP